MFSPYLINLSAGQWQKIEAGVQVVEAMIVSVTQGVLDVWLGEVPSPAGMQPVWRFRSGRPPVQIMLSGRDQLILTVAAARDCKATLTLQRRP